jgi:hypothetical protein
MFFIFARESLTTISGIIEIVRIKSSQTSEMYKIAKLRYVLQSETTWRMLIKMNWS